MYYSEVANLMVNLIQKQRTVIYTDFVRDVAPIHVAIALKERGLSSWNYHGKKMSSHDKLKAVDNWCPADSDIQVRSLVSARLMAACSVRVRK